MANIIRAAKVRNIKQVNLGRLARYRKFITIKATPGARYLP